MLKTGPAGKMYDDNVPHSHPLSVEDIVAVPFVNGDNEPEFWIGKCLRIGSESTVMLGWLKPTEQDQERYKLAIGTSWEEVCTHGPLEIT